TMGNHRWRCDKPEGHGSLDLKHALSRSCDVYYYTVGDRVGLDAIAEMARRFGYGQPTGLDLGREIPGIVPDSTTITPESGSARAHAINAGIGQGEINVTPLQQAVVYAAVANGGDIVLPQIVRRIEAPDGKVIREFQPQVLRKLGLKESSLTAVRGALRAVVNEPGGTAYRSRLQDIEFAGKTGTAQVMKLGQKQKLDNLHWPLVLCTLIICSLGVWNLASATKNAPVIMALVQFRWMLVGGLFIALLLLADYRWLQTAAWPGYVAAIGLLAGVAFAGKKVLGARRWLQVGSMQVQPSEFVKLAVIIVLARWFARDETGLRKGHYGILDLLRPFAFILLPVALVMKQPDLGTALVTFAIAMTMVMFAKVKWRDVAIMFVGGAGAAVFAWSRFLKDYQKQRLLTFLNPEAYAKGAGYHAIQSVIAVGSGQWSGKGWGEGTQNQLA